MAKAGELTRDVRSLHEASGDPHGSREPFRRKRPRPRDTTLPRAGGPQSAGRDDVVKHVTYRDTRAERYRWVRGLRLLAALGRGPSRSGLNAGDQAVPGGLIPSDGGSAGCGARRSAGRPGVAGTV